MKRCSIHLICERGGYLENSPKVRKALSNAERQQYVCLAFRAGSEL